MKTIKQLLTTIAVLLCSVMAHAQDFEIDGLYYNLLSANEKTCELVGCKPEMTSINIPSSVTTRGMTLTVNSIQKSAFENDTNLLSVSFTESGITNITENAFKGCINLRQVELSNLLDTIKYGAFDKCPIDTIFLPSNIKFIGIKGLSNVCSIKIADSNDTIYFSDNIATLKSAYIGRNISHSFVTNTSITNISFGSGITEIIPAMFKDCKQLEKITIPANIMKISYNAFNGCENLTTLTIEDSDNILELSEDTIWTNRKITYDYGSDYVDYACTHKGLFYNVPIKKIYIGRNLSYPSSSTRGFIDRTYFDGIEYDTYGNILHIRLNNYNYLGSPFNGNVEKITFGDKVTEIGDFFFENSKITSFKVPNNCKALGEYCFKNCVNLNYIDLNNCDTIKSYCFCGCESFKKLLISDNVKGIQQGAFQNCSNLRMVSIGDNISSLSQNCFADCTKLEWISLGRNVSNIQSGAFDNCTQIKNIEIKNINPPVFENENELSSVNKFDATLYIPEGTTSNYEQAIIWQDFLFKEEKEIPEYTYTPTKSDTESGETENTNKNVTISGDLTGAIINEINNSSVIETLDLQTATIALDNKNIYYTSGTRIDSHWDDIDVVRGAPYYSYKYYTAPETVSNSEKEYNSSGKLINVITTCFSSELTEANLNENIKSLKLPSSLTKLGENAIKGTNLTDLYVFSTTPPIATSSSFGNTNKTTCVLHVPEGCKDIYKNAIGWRDFKNIDEGPTENYIKVQPTNENCRIELAQNDTNATYQWYKYVNKTDKIIDITNLFTSESGWENTNKCWESNIHDSLSTAILSYEHTFTTGDILSFDWKVNCEETFDQLQIYLDNELLLTKSGEECGSYNKTFESSTTSKLKIIYIKDNIINFADDKVQISNIKITSLEEQQIEIPEIIENENTNELTIHSASYNESKIFCIVNLSDGKSIKSNEFIWQYKNFIKTQPTIDNFIVELDTPDENAQYQWYQYVNKFSYSQEIIPTSSGTFAWTESNGVWTSGNKENYFYSSSTMTATIDVQVGDIISFDYTVPEGDGSDYSGSQWFKFYMNERDIMTNLNGTNGSERHYEIEIDDFIFEYWLNGNSQITIEFNCTRTKSPGCATVSNIKHTRFSEDFATPIVEKEEIIGATTLILNDSLIAKNTSSVYCAITLPNEKVLTSDTINFPTYILTYMVTEEIYSYNNGLTYIKMVEKLYHKEIIRYNAKITLPKNPTKEGYTFSGWSEAPETMPANDITITGYFSINTYAITYMIDDEVFAIDSITFGKEIVLRDEPQKEGYTFSGWKIEGFDEIPETMPAQNLKIIGYFTINNYAVNYVIDSEKYATDSVVYGSEIILRDEPEKEGYTFSGWSEAPETMPANDITITGSFSINTYTITYLIDDEVFAIDSLTYGSKIVLRDEPTKEGYTFNGWSEVPETMPANDVTITGHFSINTYAITYMIDDEVFAIDSLTYGSKIVLRDEPEKEGYVFSGWSKAPETMPANDITITGSFDATAIQNVTIDATNIEIKDNSIILQNINNSTITIYTINGVLVKSIDNYAGEEIALDKGLYIVCIGNESIKIKI